MKIEYDIESGSCLPLSEIKSLENSVGALPSDFKEFLANNGSGTPKKRVLSLPSGGDAVIQCIRSFSRSDFIKDEYILEHDSNFFLVFADDSFGNWFSIKLGDRKLSPVYFIDRDSALSSGFDAQNISPDFKGFLESLMDEESSDEQIKNIDPEVYEDFEKRLEALKRKSGLIK
ncbi:hypothetical protein A3759_13945 [Thalassolituus sp. HI0120]|nr:hypothetical protein A3759_13945 [Thalassolituus sp. HI0120]